jgi:hypothetical protein
MRPPLIRGFWGLMLVALALVFGLLGLGCNRSESTGVDVPITAGPTTSGALDGVVSTEIPVSGTDTLAPTTTAPPPTTPTNVAVAASEELLPDGRIKAIGYIENVWEDGSGRHLTIDYIDYLEGEEADAAAVAAGEILPGEYVDDGFWISNVNPKLRTFDVSNSVGIVTWSWGDPDLDMDQPCSWADFVSFWGPGPLPEATPPRGVPWWIFREGNTVVEIQEQYLP